MRGGSTRNRRSLPLGAFVLLACSNQEPSAPAYEGPSTSAGATDTGETLPEPDTTTAPTASADSSADTDPGTTSTDPSGDSTGAPPAIPEIQWVGRWDDTDPAVMRAGWSGAGLVVRFDGTGATIDLDDQGRYHTVVVDGVVQPPLATDPGITSYVLAADLLPGEHTIEMYRRTEGSFGPTAVLDLTLDGELLPPPVVDRRMEVIGDSITAGYGNEGVSPCGFSAETENHYQTYGAIAARTVGAQVHTVAWSGKGIIYNYGDDVNEPLPEVYDRTIATESAPWHFGWQPDVVVINLGTNDFSTDNDPSQQLFVDSYVQLLTHLRDVYPQTFMLVVAPTLFGAEATMVEGYLLDVVAQRQAAGDPDVAFADINVTWIGSGCDGHPTVATHEGMGDRLVEELALHLGW